MFPANITDFLETWANLGEISILFNGRFRWGGYENGVMLSSLFVRRNYRLNEERPSSMLSFDAPERLIIFKNKYILIILKN